MINVSKSTTLNQVKVSHLMSKYIIGLSKRIGEMGRKRLDNPMKSRTISVDQKLWDDLQEDGVNISRLFRIIARKYLRKKRKNLNK